MANLNKVMLIGNLTRDPDVKMLPSQTMVCDIGLAINRRWTGQDGIRKEETTFVDCSGFGKTAELISKYVKKGDPIFIDGRLKLDQWEAQDGTKRSKMRVVIENFQFLSRGPGGGQGSIPAAEPGEYAGEPAAATPQQRPAYRAPGGRPAAQPPRPAAAPQQAAPNYDAGDVPSVPADDAPQISQDDIPF